MDRTLESKIMPERMMNLQRHKLNAGSIVSTKPHPASPDPAPPGTAASPSSPDSLSLFPVGDSLEFACTPVLAFFAKLVTCPGEKQREGLGEKDNTEPDKDACTRAQGGLSLTARFVTAEPWKRTQLSANRR